MAAKKPAWQEREARIAGVFLVFLVAIAAAALGRLPILVEATLGAILGYGLAFLLVYLWGERTRPKANGPWALLVILWLVLVAITSFVPLFPFRVLGLALILVTAAALLARHDVGLAPSFLLGGAVWSSLFLSGALLATQEGHRLTDSDGTWMATTSILGIAAATWEHERLARRDGAPTPAVWTVMRFAFLGVWTIVVLLLRAEVQWGRLFVLFGANLTGPAGQMLLVGLIVAGFALAAFAFKPTKKKPAQ